MKLRDVHRVLASAVLAGISAWLAVSGQAFAQLAVSATAAFGVAVLFWRAARRAEQAREEERVKIYRLIVEWLRHDRHDRMNEIQVLLGYLKLNKADRLRSYLEATRDRLIKEGRIARLGVPELTVFLHTFGAVWRHVRLDVRFPDGLELDRLPLDARRAVKTLVGVMEALASSASGDDGLPASLTVELAIDADGGAFLSAMRLAGTYEKQLLSRLWNERVRPLLRGGVTADRQETADGVSVRVRVPFVRGRGKMRPMDRGEPSCLSIK